MHCPDDLFPPDETERTLAAEGMKQVEAWCRACVPPPLPTSKTNKQTKTKNKIYIYIFCSECIVLMTFFPPDETERTLPAEGPGSGSEETEAWRRLSCRVCVCLSDALARGGQHGEAVRAARLAAQVKPGVWGRQRGVGGWVVARGGQHGEAVRAARLAAQVKPGVWGTERGGWMDGWVERWMDG